MKTNGARILESLGIPFELREYEVDPEDLSAITVAKKIGMPPEQVFKTLLTTGGPNIVSSSPSSPVTPSWTSRSWPAPPVCARPRWFRSRMCSRSPATSVAASPSSARRKPIPSSSMKPAILFDQISVSAGARGTQLILAPGDYLRATQAQTANLTKDLPLGSISNRNLGAPSMRALGEWVGNDEPNHSTPEDQAP